MANGASFPFSAELEAMLRKQAANRQGCEYVCYRLKAPLANISVRIGNFRKVWTRLCVKLELGKFEPVFDKAGKPVHEPLRYEHSKPKQKMRYTGLLLHDLRRTFITDAENAAVPRHEAMMQQGRSPVRSDLQTLRDWKH